MIKHQIEAIKQVLTIFYAFLAMSVIVSLFGMVNTLVLAVFERTREIGMLRAIGVSRRQLRRMIRDESIITGLIGAALGLPLGVFLAAILTRALASEGVSFHLPISQLVIFTLIAVTRRNHGGRAARTPRLTAERPPGAPVRVIPTAGVLPGQRERGRAGSASRHSRQRAR